MQEGRGKLYGSGMGGGERRELACLNSQKQDVWEDLKEPWEPIGGFFQSALQTPSNFSHRLKSLDR
jgi:hypothetical protein